MFLFLETFVSSQLSDSCFALLPDKVFKSRRRFIASLDKKTAVKVFYNIDLAEQTNDPKLFKKLQGEIWEFRAVYLGSQVRLLAFWDEIIAEQTLVFGTHGFVKKASKVPGSEINKAGVVRKQYFEAKAAKEKQSKK